MANDTRKIREMIGNDNIDAALEALIQLLDSREDDGDLMDQSILQKGRWAEYRRKEMAGIADTTEINKIRDTLLKIARELDKRMKEAADKPTPPAPQPLSPGLQQRPPQQQYVAQCFFNGDVNHYFVLSNNQIVAVNPMTNYTMAIASRTPSMDPNFAWVYQFPNGAYYSIDQQGAIWGVNAFGMPMQMGYVQYF
ncbi:MAG: hypothetical protein IPL65_13285 [Lewinellaceae bacterium]|nr:hypothetical protein [Lewinellaceae bacterium]